MQSSGGFKQRHRQMESTARQPPRRTQDQEQAAAEEEKAGGHGVLLLKETFKRNLIANKNKSYLIKKQICSSWRQSVAGVDCLGAVAQIAVTR